MPTPEELNQGVERMQALLDILHEMHHRDQAMPLGHLQFLLSEEVLELLEENVGPPERVIQYLLQHLYAQSKILADLVADSYCEYVHMQEARITEALRKMN